MKLRYERFSEQHFSLWEKQLLQDNEVMAFVYDYETGIQKLPYYLEHWSKYGFGWYSVFSGDEFVGRVGLFWNNSTPPEVEIGYTLCRAFWKQGIAFEACQFLLNEFKHSSIPLTLIALKSTQVIGAVSLHENDEIRADLSPWLESLVVDKDYQNQGVGKLLVQEVKQKARDLHFKKLYLFAFEPNLVTYYEQLGFQSIGIDTFQDRAVTIMESIL